MQESNKRLQIKNLIKNPFIGKIILVPYTRGRHYLVDMQPVYPEFYKWGILLFIISFVISGYSISLWLLPGIVVYSIGFFWSKYFIYLMLRVGLHRHGYKGPIRMVKREDILRHIINRVV